MDLCVQICGIVVKFVEKTNNPVELANTECGTECGTGPIVGLSILYSHSNFAHNVSFSEKLGNFPEIFSVRMVVFGM